MISINKRTYEKKVKKASPPSPVFKDCLLAFLFGGFICSFGEALSQIYIRLGLDIKESRMAVSISLIALSALLTGLGIYEKIAKYGGAGTLVPITGFANSMVSPAMEFKSEGLVTGTGAKLFIVAGPVIVYGATASVIYGIVLYCISLF